MKTRFFALGCAAAWCALMVTAPVATPAAIDDQQFNELKAVVTKLGQQIEKQDQRIDQLEKTHAQDGQVHAQDQQKIQSLEQKLGQTQQTVADVQQRAAMAAPIEPMPRMPLDEATVNHNFSILGDAGFQYAKTSVEHRRFLLAEYAPVFPYRCLSRAPFEVWLHFTRP